MSRTNTLMNSEIFVGSQDETKLSSLVFIYINIPTEMERFLLPMPEQFDRFEEA